MGGQRHHWTCNSAQRSCSRAEQETAGYDVHMTQRGSSSSHNAECMLRAQAAGVVLTLQIRPGLALIGNQTAARACTAGAAFNVHAQLVTAVLSAATVISRLLMQHTSINKVHHANWQSPH